MRIYEPAVPFSTARTQVLLQFRNPRFSGDAVENARKTVEKRQGKRGVRSPNRGFFRPDRLFFMPNAGKLPEIQISVEK